MKKEKFDIKSEIIRLKELINESEVLWKNIPKLKDEWKKERGSDTFQSKRDENVYVQIHDGRVNFVKSLGHGDYVELRSWSDYRDKDKVTYALRYFKVVEDDMHVDHRTDGPARFSTKDFKRASSEYYLDGAKVPQYFYEENFAKIRYMSSVVNIIKKKYPNYHVVSKPKEAYIRIDLPEKYIKYEELTKFVEDLKVTVSKNFNFSVVAGYDMTLTIRMWMSKDANIENETALEKNSDFFN